MRLDEVPLPQGVGVGLPRGAAREVHDAVERLERLRYVERIRGRCLHDPVGVTRRHRVRYFVDVRLYTPWQASVAVEGRVAELRRGCLVVPWELVERVLAEALVVDVEEVTLVFACVRRVVALAPVVRP